MPPAAETVAAASTTATSAAAPYPRPPPRLARGGPAAAAVAPVNGYRCVLDQTKPLPRPRATSWPLGARCTHARSREEVCRSRQSSRHGPAQGAHPRPPHGPRRGPHAAALREAGGGVWRRSGSAGHPPPWIACSGPERDGLHPIDDAAPRLRDGWWEMLDCCTRRPFIGWLRSEVACRFQKTYGRTEREVLTRSSFWCGQYCPALLHVSTIEFRRVPAGTEKRSSSPSTKLLSIAWPRFGGAAIALLLGHKAHTLSKARASS